MPGNAGMELHINGRDIEDSSTIPLTKSPDKMWTLASRQEAAEMMRSDTRAAVANAMREGASSPKEIAEAAGLPVATVDKQLSRMVRQEEVIKTGRGSYVLVEI
jgi:DNA-directed RNA polymerase specialized sigma24 family protein